MIYFLYFIVVIFCLCKSIYFDINKSIFYSSGKIIPDLCSCTFSTTRIDLRITKAIPNHWLSLETKKAVIGNCILRDFYSSSQKVTLKHAESYCSSHVNQSINRSIRFEG